MITIINEYLKYRKGSEEDYLFCSEEGGMLTEEALSSSIKRYNKKRGVEGIKSRAHIIEDY